MPDVPSTISSSQSSHEFSVSRVASNGNGGVVSSVIWLAIAAGLCFPWLLDKPVASKADDTAKSVAWYVVLGLDLIVGTMAVFSLWFRRSALSVLLLIWGSCAIVVTYLVGSFAMLPAVATMCCCAPEVCAVGAADMTSLDDTFCYVNPDICIKTKWSLWCYYGGILLTMVSMVLLVNGVALHHKTLLDCERRRTEALKAARAARRARRRRQELWEDEVYGRGCSSSRTVRVGTSPYVEENAGTPPAGERHSTAIAPMIQSPPATPQRSTAPSAPAAPAVGGDAPAGVFGSIPNEAPEGDIMRYQASPTSASRSRDGSGDRTHAIGACTGLHDERKFRGLKAHARKFRSWGRTKQATKTEVFMSWVADEESGGGRITPKTALRFKTSALARAMHN